MAQQPVDDVLAEARAAVAAGRFPDVIALRERLAGDADALARLDRVLAVHRARARVAQPAATRAPARSRLRTKPSVNADKEVRKAAEYVLAWDALAAVPVWEVRISERADARSDYEPTRSLETAEPRVELPLGDRPMKVHIVGRSGSSKVLRRAVVSGVTRDSWHDRWQKR